ncbi:hypothetical protein Hanom_Chr08g00709221 [Helianthus anomalus]
MKPKQAIHEYSSTKSVLRRHRHCKQRNEVEKLLENIVRVVFRREHRWLRRVMIFPARNTGGYSEE